MGWISYWPLAASRSLVAPSGLTHASEREAASGNSFTHCLIWVAGGVEAAPSVVAGLASGM
jgi:hypothetical protein